VISGEFNDAHGPAQTFTPVTLLDVQLRAGKHLRLNLHEGYTAALFILKGAIKVNADDSAKEGELVILNREGDEVELEATSDATVFVMNGQPIDEPIVGHGPFVMNTRQQIEQAYEDFQSGRFGRAQA
jgi:redox-sensitive bicupin YhaK (pirin superfamily)